MGDLEGVFKASEILFLLWFLYLFKYVLRVRETSLLTYERLRGFRNK